MRSRGRLRRAATLVAGVQLLVLPFVALGYGYGYGDGYGDGDGDGDAGGYDEGSSGCLTCHAGIEPMHPEAELSCVDCHGGDAAATSKNGAHVSKPRVKLEDERVADLKEDLAWRRFHNPMDLRVVERTCATCHEKLVEHLRTGLHGTTAGHLSDGYYEMGLLEERGSKYSVFPVSGAVEAGGAVESLEQVPPFQENLPAGEVSSHYTDLARKECMQCHLWSEGRAVRGRVGFDGDYRGEGCAACHVPYALHGLSESADPTAPRSEPGHPLRHALTRAPTTQTCASCHYGDASVGLHFRGLSQLPPGAPGGPDIPGTTNTPLNRVFYLNDPKMAPPDIHHEKGMHCIDCHTLGDVMGDGRLHGQMEHAVEISCSACHGTFTERSTLVTERGTPLAHLRMDDGGRVVLRSKVDGREHEVPQVVDVLDPNKPEYNEEAANAMTAEHANIECYTCHAGWNINFLGFHFSRNASLSQLDLLSGRRTPGRVTTQEKVFATWKSFYAGLNEAGRVAPYLTGFSTMGSIWDQSGELVVDQQMPVTAAGLSGMTMVHHQLHSTRPTARSCVECHRSSATWGLGSPNFKLARQLAFVGDRRGLEIVGLNRANLAASPPLAKLVLPDIVAIAVDCDDLQGYAHHLYVAEGGRGIHVIDVTDPTAPERVAFVPSINPKNLKLVGDDLYLADGIGGLRVYDVSKPEKIELVAKLAMFDARDVDVQWPWAYVADGPGGLAIVDVRAPIAPRFVSAVDLNGDSRVPNQAVAVRSLFQYSRPMAADDTPIDYRHEARMLCAVVDRELGLYLVDATEATRPEVVYPHRDDRDRSRALGPGMGGRRGSTSVVFRGLALLSQVDLAEAQGGEPTSERDYAYVLLENTLANGNRRSSVVLYDVTDPRRVRIPRNAVEAGFSTEMLAPAAVYNTPFLQKVLFSPGELGVLIADVSISREPAQQGVLPGLLEAYAVAVEEFPLDRMIDEKGRKLKDISHPESRWLYRAEIEKILDVPGEELGLIDPFDPPPDPPGITARLHLERLDEDDSGMLEGEEYGPAGGESVDLNGDGRISLGELADQVGLLDDGRSKAPEDGMEPIRIRSRNDPDGDLARLFDGIDPYYFDKDKTGRLTRVETTRAMFAALDLDGDGKLSPAELSRHPGSLRRIRYDDFEKKELVGRLDSNGDMKVTKREFEMRDQDWYSLDQDGDGFVQLPADPRYVGRYEQMSGNALVEWPYRRQVAVPISPIISLEKMREVFDKDDDGELSRREMRSRTDLFDIIDFDGNGRVDEMEITRIVDLVSQAGVEVTVDDFVGRWDLDGDGKVEEVEVPSASTLRLRGLLGRR